MILHKLGLWVAIFLLTTTAQATPQIVASIKPIADIVGEVALGVSTPTVLVPTHQSPHSFQLRPSQAQQLSQAALIFWVGAELETFLPDIISSIAPQAHSIPLLTAMPVQLRYRQGKQWQTDSFHSHNHEHHHLNPIDVHIWLSPENALAIAAIAKKQLSTVDHNNSAIYEKNYHSFKNALADKEQQLKKQLHTTENKAFLVFHDGYHYFEHSFALQAKGALALHSGAPLSAKRLQAIGQRIAAENIACLFHEPTLNNNMLIAMQQSYNVQLAELDPMGRSATVNGASYLATLQAMADSISGCL